LLPQVIINQFKSLAMINRHQQTCRSCWWCWRTWRWSVFWCYQARIIL